MRTDSVLASLSTDEITLLIEGVFANPISALMSDTSIQIKIVNGESLIAETPLSSSLYVVPPLQIEELATLLISQDNLTAGGLTSISVDFELTQEVPRTSEIVLKVAHETLVYYGSARNPQCFAKLRNNYKLVTCSVKARGTQAGQPTYVEYIKLQGFESLGDFWKLDDTIGIRIDGVMNVEFARARDPDLAHELLVVSESGFVLTQGSSSDALLPDLQPNKIASASVTRESVNIGEEDVRYEIVFKAANLIRGDAYALIHVPTQQATV